MNRALLRVGSVILGIGLLWGCGSEPASDLKIERLPEVHPNLPAVPPLPPPPYPVQHPDQSYTVYGLRKRLRNTIDTDVSVTAYIVDVYHPPECPEGRTCATPAAPHLWLADARDDHEERNRLTLVGYAENQGALDEAIEAAQRGHPILPEHPEAGELQIPFDFFAGAKIKVQGRFAYMSVTGFSEAGGVLEYRSHTTIEPAPESAQPQANNRPNGR